MKKIKLTPIKEAYDYTPLINSFSREVKNKGIENILSVDLRPLSFNMKGFNTEGFKRALIVRGYKIDYITIDNQSIHVNMLISYETFVNIFKKTIDKLIDNNFDGTTSDIRIPFPRYLSKEIKTTEFTDMMMKAYPDYITNITFEDNVFGGHVVINVGNAYQVKVNRYRENIIKKFDEAIEQKLVYIVFDVNEEYIEVLFKVITEYLWHIIKLDYDMSKRRLFIEFSKYDGGDSDD